MKHGIEGKVVVITGGSSGIGKAAVHRFLQAGCKVAVCGRDNKKLECMKNSLSVSGYSIMTAVVDVAKTDALEHFASTVYDAYGKIDIWINNAGINLNRSIFELSECDWDSVMSVNLKAVLFGCKTAAVYMKNNNGGVILNASSFQALIPFAGCSIYAASKAGVLSLTKSLAGELAPYNIRVIAYIPGLIATELTKNVVEKNKKRLLESIALNRLGEPEEIADLLVFLSSEAAKYITGTHIEVSGGKFCVQNQNYSW